MRKLLMGLTVLLGATAAVSGARAAPQLTSPIPFAAVPAAVQPVHYDYYPAQYDEGWRSREWRRHEEYERWRRHQEWRRERFEDRWHDHRGW